MKKKMIKEMVRGFIETTYLVTAFLGLAIHLWTVFIAFKFSGILAAIISFFLPVFAEIFWVIRVNRHTGDFCNIYCLTLIGYVILLAVIIIADKQLGLSDYYYKT